MLYGTAGSAAVEKAAHQMEVLRSRLRQYSLENIYNVDETALFFKCLPRKTYILPDENIKSLRGTKAMNAKDRITAIVCTNANGSTKIPITIIGVSSNPRALQKRTPPCYYFSNRKAWSNKFLFNKWLNDVFIPHIQSDTQNRIALILDNVSAHSDVIVPESIDNISLPPNVTSIHQPMDMGVIRSWKAGYRRLMLRAVLNDITTRIERRRINAGNIRGRNGLSDGYDPNLWDVCELSKSVWDEIQPATVARCWVKAKCLPCIYETELEQNFGKVGKALVSDKVDDIVKLIQQLNMVSTRVTTEREIVGEVTEWVDL